MPQFVHSHVTWMYSWNCHTILRKIIQLISSTHKCLGFFFFFLNQFLITQCTVSCDSITIQNDSIMISKWDLSRKANQFDHNYLVIVWLTKQWKQQHKCRIMLNLPTSPHCLKGRTKGCWSRNTFNLNVSKFTEILMANLWLNLWFIRKAIVYRAFPSLKHSLSCCNG